MAENKKMMKNLWWIVPIFFLVVFLYKAFSTSEDLEGVQKISNLGNEHIVSIEAEHNPYNSNPPTSGPHTGNKAPWGVGTEIIPDEMQIHNLEDGGVIIQYNPEKISKDEMKQLEDIVRGSSRRNLIAAPRYDMEYNIALTAWNKLLSLDNVDELKIKAFINKFEGTDHHVRR